jgi:hypothetical protein
MFINIKRHGGTMHNPMPGWTKSSIIAQLKRRNNGNKSVNSVNNNCAYRGENGNACAIGCFLPDDLYSRSMEGMNIHQLFKLLGGTNAITWMPLSVLAMEELQAVHDYSGKGKGEALKAMVDWVTKNVSDGGLWSPHTVI